MLLGKKMYYHNHLINLIYIYKTVNISTFFLSECCLRSNYFYIRYETHCVIYCTSCRSTCLGLPTLQWLCDLSIQHSNLLEVTCLPKPDSLGQCLILQAPV